MSVSKHQLRKINKKILQTSRVKSRKEKLVSRYEAIGDIVMSSKSIQKNDDIHRIREEKEAKEAELYFQYLQQLWWDEDDNENNNSPQIEYYNPVQIFSHKNVYIDYSDNGDCFCKNKCDCEQTYLMKNSIGDKVLAPRFDGRCYCGRIREECPNYKAYGTDCQGFGQVRFT